MIRVDGAEIPETAIAAEIQFHPAGSRQAAWHDAAQALVVRRLLRAEAERRGFEADNEEGAVARLLDADITVPEADEATCRRWHAANRARLMSPEAWHAAHILIAADPADAEARRAAETLAAEFARDIAEDPTRLAPLATRYSACSSREQGGDLGLIEPGTTVAEFEAALRALAPGETSAAPVGTGYGYHVIHLRRHEPGRELPFDAVRDCIAAWLREASWRRALHQYIAILAGRARIEGIDLAVADGPLVQ